MTGALIILGRFCESQTKSKSSESQCELKNASRRGDAGYSRSVNLRPVITAVLIDGGFYRRRANKLFGEKSPEDHANEMVRYARRHIAESRSSLYRIFYYDCPASVKVLFHPLTRTQVNLAATDQFRWTQKFFEALTHKRKVALRRGRSSKLRVGMF